MAADCRRRRTNSGGLSLGGSECQEQIQITTSAIGRPKPNVPTIVSENSKSGFDARGPLRTVMTLFL
jgi:hypothetical protein